jgi:transcriptional regulator with XRE-family HTH domain
MLIEQLGKKLNMTKGAIQKIEEREASGQISLKKLKEAGQALDMKFEDQGIGDENINKAIEDLAIEIKRELRRSIWD